MENTHGVSFLYNSETRRRPKRRRPYSLVVILAYSVFVLKPLEVDSYQLGPSVTKWSKQVREGYHSRVAADPSFLQKSFTEVLVAAGTQFAAEWNRRGAHRMIPESDFVLPAILTAVFGKYYR
jgi:Protein RETICULATA-related